MSQQVQMINVALEAGVAHFYSSEFGGDIERQPFINERYFRDKLLTRAHLRAKAKEVSSFKYTYTVCGVCAEVFAVYPGFDWIGRRFLRLMEIRRTCGLFRRCVREWSRLFDYSEGK
jgi:hypothetical protein